MQICWKFSLLNLKIVLRKIGGDGVEGGSTTNGKCVSNGEDLTEKCITLKNKNNVKRSPSLVITFKVSSFLENLFFRTFDKTKILISAHLKGRYFKRRILLFVSQNDHFSASRSPASRLNTTHHLLIKARSY